MMNAITATFERLFRAVSENEKKVNVGLVRKMELIRKKLLMLKTLNLRLTVKGTK